MYSQTCRTPRVRGFTPGHPAGVQAGERVASRLPVIVASRLLARAVLSAIVLAFLSGTAPAQNKPDTQDTPRRQPPTRNRPTPGKTQPPPKNPTKKRAGESDARHPTRWWVRFPEDRSLGMAAIRPEASSDELAWILLVEARGGILIPPRYDVKLITSPDACGDLSVLGTLPPNALRAVSLCGAQLDEEKLAHLQRFTQLDELDLRWCQLEPNALRALIGIRSLRAIYLRKAKLPEPDLKYLAAVKTLEVLELPAGIGPAGLARLSELTALKRLDLADDPKVDDKSLAALTSLKPLRALDVSGTAITSAGLESLARLTGLEELELARTRVGDDGLKSLAALRRLWKLDLTRTDVGDAGLEHLARMWSLEVLLLGGTKVTDQGLKSLGRFDVLRELSLANTGVTDAGVATLAALPSIEDLHLSGTKITDASCTLFEHMRELKRLVIRQTAITPARIERLKKTKPNCTVVH